jgi:dihydropteroate synthase
MNAVWKTSRRELPLDRPLIMGILNVTPDSFSDGGQFADVDTALRRAERMIDEGVDILDIGGESTRPGSDPVDPDVEVKRTLPVISAISRRFDVPISIDTTKHLVAKANLDNGAEIINDISGLRWDPRIADVAARSGAGLVLMHSRGEFATMHSQPAVDDIFQEVASALTRSVELAKHWGVSDEQIVLDVGVGFGKTVEQNLGLIANLDKLSFTPVRYPILVGASRKSFIGKLLGDRPPTDRLGGSVAAAILAVDNGASIVRVHDVRETVTAIKFWTAAKRSK